MECYQGYLGKFSTPVKKEEVGREREREWDSRLYILGQPLSFSVIPAMSK